MSLQRRLLLTLLAMLLVMAALFTAFWLVMRFQVLPHLEAHFRGKARQYADVLARELDVALAARDPQEVSRVVQSVRADPDVVYIEVRDASGRQMYLHDPRRLQGGLAAEPARDLERPGYHATTRAVALEGLALGRLALACRKDLVNDLLRWLLWFAGGAVTAFAAAVVGSVLFSRHFVRPIAEAARFSDRVAGGEFGARLEAHAPGELRLLVTSMNAMAEALAGRDRTLAERQAQLEASLAALREAQSRLVESSRQAGMAEIATNILHNVGNVLTSIKTSATVLGERLDSLGLNRFERTAELLEAHQTALARFFTEDPRGMQLPLFLRRASEAAARELAAAQAELERLGHSVDHVAEVVALQQNYARGHSVLEEVRPRQIVETALELSRAALERHDISTRLVVDVDEEIRLDRHKVLQILVNLLNNAKDALDEVRDRHREICVRSARGEGGRLQFQVRDNGPGIAPENLTRIFGHGFTTKRSGHGFGLHASANLAAEMGGKLSCDSAPGHGATFILDLPWPAAQGVSAGESVASG
jgi:signal transduction histidine kinase